MNRHIIQRQGEIPALFNNSETIAIDTETYSLSYYSKCFAIQITDGQNTAYINLNSNGPIPYNHEQVLQEVTTLISRSKLLVFTNAKFDLHRLKNTGLDFNIDRKPIWCTMVFERMLDNDSFAVGMDASLRKRGREKNKSVEEYIKNNKLVERVLNPLTNEYERNKRFDLVPFEVMSEYGFSDVENTFWIHEQQKRELEEFKIPNSLIENELLLTSVVWKMERRGFKIDLPKVANAIEYETLQIGHITSKIESLLGRSYVGGPIFLEEAMKDLGLKVEYSSNGKAKNDEETLSNLDHPVFNAILDLRKHEKNINTFYSSFIYYGSWDSSIHANYNLASTNTGRFSCSEPNIQQVPSGDEEYGFSPRGCFIPREDHILVSIDYDAMEFKLMSDIAGEMKLIRDIKNGLDVHTSTAKLVNVDRKTAKTLNFGLLYGMGKQKLADALNISVDQATEIRNKYFYNLPNIKQFLRDVQDVATRRGYIFNWAGRKYRLKDPNFAYKMANYLIQGGSSDIVKFSMVEIDKLFSGKQSGIVAMLHDELILEIHKSELDLVWKVKSIMESTYKPVNGLNMSCGVEIHTQSWASNTGRVIKQESELYD